MDDTHWLEADRAAFISAWTTELAEVPEFLGSHAAHRPLASSCRSGSSSPRTKPASTGCRPMTASASSDAGSRPPGCRPRWPPTRRNSRPRRSMPSFSRARPSCGWPKGWSSIGPASMGVNRIELSGFSEAAKDRLKGRWLLLGDHQLEAAALLPDGCDRGQSAGSSACTLSCDGTTCTGRVLSHVFRDRRCDPRSCGKRRERVSRLPSRPDGGKGPLLESWAICRTTPAVALRAPDRANVRAGRARGKLARSCCRIAW